ncbi:hypothetical protein WI697_04605 [Tistrella mobilis]|uniref:hypothetical protein n=1 Tax=Tistrella mobilis TaxID=171437 RepID=UPI0031F6BC86
MSTATTPAAPVISSVSCTTGGTRPVFSLAWIIQQGYTGPFTIIVTTAGGTAVTGTASGMTPNGGTWTAGEDMNAQTTMYYVQVAVQSDPTIISDRAPLLFAPVTNITTAYDGITLSVGWTAAASAMPAGQTQIRLTTGGGSQVASVTSGTVAQFVVAPNLRKAGGTWTVKVTPVFDISSGPVSDPATVLYARPDVTAVAVVIPLETVNTTITVSGAGLPDSGDVWFIANLLQDGRAVATTAPIAGTRIGTRTWQFPAGFGIAADLAHDYAVTAALSSATAGTATGPDGSAMGLVLLTPMIDVVTTASGTDRTVTVTVLPPAGDWRISGSAISVLAPDGQPVTGGQASGTGLTHSVTLAGLTIGGAYTVIAAACRGSSTGPYTTTRLPLLTSAPALTTASLDGGVVTAAWNTVADAGVTGYRLDLVSGTGVMASGSFSGGSGSLPVPQLPAGDQGAAPSLVVTAMGSGTTGRTTGPASAALTLISEAVAVTGIAFPAAGGDVTATLSAAGQGEDGYTLELWKNGTLSQSLTSATTAVTVPAAALTDPASYTVRGRATRSNAAVKGPWSAFTPLGNIAPAGLAIAYDGATATLSWRAVEGASAYLVTGIPGSGGVLTTAPALTAAIAYASDQNPTLSVQAITGVTTGPAASAQVFAAGLYPTFAQDTAAAIIPATTPAMTAYQITIGLPQLFTTPPAAADLPAVAPFAIVEGTAPYTYALTIAGDPEALPWTFTADAVRPDLVTAWNGFLTALETATATPLAIQTVQAAIARAMPQTFVETLFFGYSFNPDKGYVDLLPGMVLRVEFEAYTSMPAGSTDQNYLNGFVTSAVARWQVGRMVKNGVTCTVLDEFVGLVTGQGGTAVPRPVPANRKVAGAGGLIDTGWSTMQQPLLRLVYPQAFPSCAQPGTPYPELNAVLLAASKLSDLEAATQAAHNGTDASARAAVLYFRGRTTLVAEIRILVNGVEQLVPLGTTLGDVLAARAQEPSAAGLPLTGIRLTRGTGPAPAGTPASYNAGGGQPLRVDWAPAANAAMTALPLMAGDRIEIGTPPAGAA